MTIDQVRAGVEAIRAVAADDEAAHAREDELHQDVLRCIATGEIDDAKACAAEALKTCDIEFARWCA